ncbi:hypothetical protein TWF106_005001 [Orbilia oligospora]|uniref:Uncharacterized protein n=1 Tax=Orbilia oligospora TaxID=2813651 RepID=A0A7C8UGW5_ORBOL|nr:hypothetical protein TWF106_005001 [Orbilia oligospora]
MMPKKITSNYPHWSRGASLREEPNPHSLVIDITDHPKITLFTDAAGQTNELAWEVNRVLEDVFRVGRASVTGENGWKCPLEHESHFVEDINGRKVLKLAIKATVNDATAFSEIATEFCQKLFTKEAFLLLGRVSYSGVFGISPRPGTVFEGIWISSFAASVLKERERLDRLGLIYKDSIFRVWGRWLINICYALSVIFTFYQFSSWTAECIIHFFGIHSIWNDPYMYAYSYHSRSIPPSVMTFRTGLFFAIYLIVICAFLGPVYANDFEAKIRDKELYRKLENLDWRKQCEDTTKVADEIVRCLQQRRMGDPTNSTPSPTISTDYTIGSKLCTLLHLLPQLYHQNQEISHIHDQIQRNDQSLAKLYFILTAITASVFRWSGRLNATTPHSTATAIAIVVVGSISTGLFAGSGVYVAQRAEKRRRGVIEKCGDVNNRILKVWRSVQKNYSYLVWVYATNHGTPRFTTEGLEKQWSEWITDVDVADPNVILNPGFSNQIGEFGQYLADVQDEILS